MRTAATGFVAAALVLSSGTALAEDLTSSGGFLFDISNSDGSLNNGSVDAYDGCYRLDVNGSSISAGGTPRVEGRRVVLQPVTTGELQVTRTIFVSDVAGQDYARYVDFIQNQGSSRATVVVRYSGNLGSDSSTMVWGSSSGDRGVGADDQWYGTDDNDGERDPTLAHAFWSEGGRLRPLSQSLSSDSVDTQFSVEVGPGETVAFMIFAFQGPNQAAMREQVAALYSSPASATTDLSPQEAGQIVNWSVVGSSSWVPPLASSGDSAASLAGAASYDFEAEAPPEDSVMARSSAGEGPPPTAGVASASRAAPRRPPLLYEGSLGLAVEDVEEAITAALDIAEELGGHLSRQEERTLVVRVPVPRFREALDRFEALGDVLGRRVSIQHVGEQLRDLRARLRAATMMRDRLVELLAEIDNVPDSLAAQREIERLNQAIALLTAELEAMQDRVHYSTITLGFQPLSEQRDIPHERFGLPFPFLDRLGLDRLLALD